MFFDSPKFIFYFKRNQIDIFSQKAKIGTVNVPPEIINHLEVLDIDAYKKLLERAIQTLKIQNSSIAVVLSEQVIYYQQLIQTDPKDLDASLRQFINAVPFDPDKVMAIIYKKQTQKILVATNKDLYEPLQIVAGLVKVVVKSVMPSIIISSPGQALVFNRNIFKRISRIMKMNNGNFLFGYDLVQKEIDLSEEDPSLQEIRKKTIRKHQYPLLILSILLLLSLPLYLGISYGLVPAKLLQFARHSSEKEIVPIPTVTPNPVYAEITPVSSQSAMIQRRQELSVRILNGSGTAGQAALIEGLLRAGGFSDIETGNAGQGDATNTVIVFSLNVTGEDRKYIADIIKGVVLNVTERLDNQNLDYDIDITTGNAKVE